MTFEAVSGHEGQVTCHKFAPWAVLPLLPPQPRLWALRGAYSLKHMEQSAPPDGSRMNQRIRVGQEARPDVPIPCIFRGIQ